MNYLLSKVHQPQQIHLHFMVSKIWNAKFAVFNISQFALIHVHSTVNNQHTWCQAYARCINYIMSVLPLYSLSVTVHTITVQNEDTNQQCLLQFTWREMVTPPHLQKPLPQLSTVQHLLTQLISTDNLPVFRQKPAKLATWLFCLWLLHAYLIRY
jgi:hypothetical protein